MPAIWPTPKKFARRRAGCWPRFPGLTLGRLARNRSLLRRGRNLQPDRAGNVRPAQPPQAGEHPLHRVPTRCITANAGCLLQIAREARDQGQRLWIGHPLDLLDMSYRGKRPER